MLCPELVGDKEGLFRHDSSCSTTTERIWVVINYTISGGELGPNTLQTLLIMWQSFSQKNLYIMYKIATVSVDIGNVAVLGGESKRGISPLSEFSRPRENEMGEQGWRSDQSARLPPIWPGFDSRTRRHMWVEFVVGSLLCSEKFFWEYSWFCPLRKNQHFQIPIRSWNARAFVNEFLWTPYIFTYVYFLFAYLR